LRDDHDHRFECVRKVPVFADLSEEDQHRVAAAAVTRHYARDEQLYGPGDRVGLHIVHTGQVKVHQITASGSDRLIRILSPGDFLGETALLADAESDHHAVAARPSEVCSIPRPGIQKLLLERPAVAMQMLQTVSARLGRAERRISTLASQPVGERLAQQLLYLVTEAGSSRVRLPTTKRDLASYLGTTPETLSRQLSALQESGVIRLGPARAVEILDPKELRRKASG
jgi:CRP/FNR family transcriptional regulator